MKITPIVTVVDVLAINELFSVKRPRAYSFWPTLPTGTTDKVADCQIIEVTDP